MKNRPSQFDNHTWRYAWQLAAPELWRCRWLLLRGYLFGLLAVSALVLLPWPLKLIIDHVMGSHPLPPWLTWAVEQLHQRLELDLNQTQMTLVLAASYAGIALVATLCGAAEKMAGAQVRERMVTVLRDKVLRHFQRLSSGQRNQRRSGDMALHILVDVHHLVRLLSKTLPLAFRHLAITVFTLSVMYLIEPLLAAAGGLMVAILALLVRIQGSKLRRSSWLKRSKEGAVAGFTQEFVKAMDTVQALSAEAYVRSRFRDLNEASLRAGVDETAAAVRMERTMQAINGIAVALIMGSSALMVLQQRLTLGDLTVFVAYMIQLLKPVEKINEMASAVSRGLTRAEHLGQLLKTRPAVQDLPGAKPILHCRGVIEMRGVSFQFPGTPRKLLDNIDLVLSPGHITVLTGPSGSGKSTLLNLILRQLIPTEGEILIDGIPYSQLTLASIRSQFGVMLQQPHLFAGKLREGLWPSEQPIDEKIIWQILAMVAMDRLIKQLPEGLDSTLDEGGSNLSGGQRARLSLARAILTGRPILLLDEPLANIDQASQEVILKALETLRDHKTIFAISHQAALLARADIVLSLDQGRLSEPHASLATLDCGPV